MSGTESSSRFRKRPSERFAGDGIDVREPGQVADERADRAAAPAARRAASAAACRARAPRARRRARARAPPSGAGRTRPARGRRSAPALRRAAPSPALVTVCYLAVAGLECAVADAGQLARSRARRGRRSPGSGSRAPGVRSNSSRSRELGGAVDGVAVVREALRHRVGCEQHALVVAAPLAFRAFERRPVADRDHRVLEERAPAVVRVDVARDDGLRRRSSPRAAAAVALRRASPRS